MRFGAREPLDKREMELGSVPDSEVLNRSLLVRHTEVSDRCIALSGCLQLLQAGPAGDGARERAGQ